jgi:hypothetical protein
MHTFTHLKNEIQCVYHAHYTYWLFYGVFPALSFYDIHLEGHDHP